MDDKCGLQAHRKRYTAILIIFVALFSGYKKLIECTCYAATFSTTSKTAAVSFKINGKRCGGLTILIRSQQRIPQVIKQTCCGMYDAHVVADSEILNKRSLRQSSNKLLQKLKKQK